MTSPGGFPDFLWQLVLQLRRRNIAIGIGDLVSLRSALRAGFGLSSPAALCDLLVALWAKSLPEAEIVRAQFEQADVGEWNLAQLADSESPAQPGGGQPVVDRQRVGQRSDKNSAEETPAPVLTQPLAAFPAIPSQLGGVGRGYHLVPQYPLTEREIAQAWRRLRRPVRFGPLTELDPAETVRTRLRLGVVTPPVVRPRRRNGANLLLLVDRQGSMTPFHGFVDHLVGAIARQGSLAAVDIWYFHDTPSVGADLAPLEGIGASLMPTLDAVLPDISPNGQGFVYREPTLRHPVPLSEALRGLGSETSVAVIGDCGAARGGYDPARLLECLAFTREVRRRRSRVVWLNPVPHERWVTSTAGQLARHVPMVSIDMVGLHLAVDVLRDRAFHLERPL
jgi:uncharacterized protein with von Willebrand factor type A (vWA) domain